MRRWRMLRSIYPRGKRDWSPSRRRPWLGYGGGALSPQVLPVLGGQLGSLSEWQSRGAALWLPFPVVAMLPRSLILLLHRSPRTLIRPRGRRPPPGQLGLGSGHPKKLPPACQRFTDAALDTVAGCFGVDQGCSAFYYNISRVLSF